MILLAALSWAQERPDTAGFVDSAVVPVRCHWQREEDEARCADVLEWAATAWAVQVDGIGFVAPPGDGGLGGSDALDIYLSLEGGAGEAWVDCVGGDGTCVDADAADGRAGAASHVVIDARTDDADLPEYVVHEFNHTTQYATDYAEPFLALWEGTAVAAQRWTLPDEPLSASELADFQATPWISTALQDGYFLEELGIWSWYEYGAGVWVTWLDEVHADGTGAVGPALWAAATQEGYGADPDVLDAWDAVAGSWRDDLLDFTADRARFGTDAAPAWLTWGGPGAYAFREATEVGAGDRLAPEYPPYPLGVSFFDVDVPAGAMRTFALEGEDGVDWALLVIDGATTSAETTFTAAADTTITLAVVNLGPPGMDADDALAPADFTLSVDAPAGDGGGDEEGPEGPPAEEGCGCATSGGLGGAWLAGLLALYSRPRSTRRPASKNA